MPLLGNPDDFGQELNAVFHSLFDRRQLPMSESTSRTVSTVIKDVEEFNDVLHVGFDEVFECFFQHSALEK